MEEVKIGEQIWMKRNLDVDTFRNGDPIPQAKTYREWELAGSQGMAVWCYYENSRHYGEKYGKLYNWYAVNDPRGIAPRGYHVLSDEEWIEFEECLVGLYKASRQMKSNTRMNCDQKIVQIGKDEIGFALVPGGFRSLLGSFLYNGKNSYYWINKEKDMNNAMFGYMHFKTGELNMNYINKKFGLSVRCIRD